jgi:hypothetical protein
LCLIQKGFYELKEKAKWSRDIEERKTASRELSSHGEKALPSLEEIRNMTAYEDIRSACIEAIRSIIGEKGSQSSGAAASDIKKRKKSKTSQRPGQD